MNYSETAHRGWTQQPDIAAMLPCGVARYQAVYPWSVPGPSFDPAQNLCRVLLTAAEVLALQPYIPASMHPEEGHNDGPSWAECVLLARAHPDLLFAGFLMPPARADEGIDLDAVYIPLPDPENHVRTRAITRPDGRSAGPDEDGVEEITGWNYRRLWWD